MLTTYQLGCTPLFQKTLTSQFTHYSTHQHGRFYIILLHVCVCYLHWVFMCTLRAKEFFFYEWLYIYILYTVLFVIIFSYNIYIYIYYDVFVCFGDACSLRNIIASYYCGAPGIQSSSGLQTTSNSWVEGWNVNAQKMRYPFLLVPRISSRTHAQKDGNNRKHIELERNLLSKSSITVSLDQLKGKSTPETIGKSPKPC